MTIRNYVKTYDRIKLSHVAVPVTKHEETEYGFITKWEIKFSDTARGHIIQKYTGHMKTFPGGVCRERTWLYDYTVDMIRITGQAVSMAKAIEVLINILESRGEQSQCSD